MFVIEIQGHCPSPWNPTWPQLWARPASPASPASTPLPDLPCGVHSSRLPVCPVQGSARCPRELWDVHLRCQPKALWPCRPRFQEGRLLSLSLLQAGLMFLLQDPEDQAAQKIQAKFWVIPIAYISMGPTESPRPGPEQHGGGSDQESIDKPPPHPETFPSLRRPWAVVTSHPYAGAERGAWTRGG